MTDGAAILLTITSTAAGSAASWFISRWYYRRSGSDLDTALQPIAGNTQQLLRATNTIGHLLKQAGIGKPTFDAEGNLTGIVVSGAGHASIGPLTASGTGSYSPPPQYDRQHEQPPSEEEDGIHA